MPSATFFDPSVDAALIRLEYRESPELETVASTAEYDVLQVYTLYPRDARWTAIIAYGLIYTIENYKTQDAGPFGLPNKLYVWLRTFKPAPSDCGPELAAALKRTIALVIDWRMAQSNYNPMLTNKSADTTHITMRSDANEPFPRNWDKAIRTFDVRPKLWGF